MYYYAIIVSIFLSFANEVIGNNKTENCSTIGCGQLCKLEGLKPICSCNYGYHLDTNMKTCSDDDECKTDMSSRCGSCINTPGSFRCSGCPEGFSVSASETMCEPNDPAPDLFYSTIHEIHNFELEFNRKYQIVKSQSNIVGLAFNPKDNRILWIEKVFYSKKGFLNSMRLDSASKESHSKLINSIDCPEDLEIDHKTSMLYIAKMCMSEIGVYKLDKNEKLVGNSTLKNKFMSRPVALAIDQINRNIFWADWGIGLGIQRAGINGSNPAVLANISIHRPKALALDILGKRLYWTDYDEGSIDSVLTNGENRKRSPINPYFTPYSLTIYGNNLYYNFKQKPYIKICRNFFASDQCKDLYVDFAADDQVTDLYIYAKN